MLNSSATQTAASGEAKQSRRKQELLTKSLKASETDSSDPALFFQTANLCSCSFVIPGRGAAGFLFGCYPYSDAKIKRLIVVPCEASVDKPVLAAATEHAV